MLKILRVPDRISLQELIRDFDPRNETWVVSDLRSKFEIQQRLLERDRGYLDTTVLRASDLWKTLLRRLLPQTRVVSRDFASSLVRSFLSQHRESLPVLGLSEKSVMALMDRFVGIVFHPEGPRVLEEWFEQNSEASDRWRARYQVAALTLRYLDSQKMMTAKWIAPVLQSVSAEKLHWDQKLIVDLGAELSSAEAGLFRTLAESTDVTLLEPAPEWCHKDEFLLRPYRDLEGLAQEIRPLSAIPRLPGKRIFKRLSGQLAEVKEAVAQARSWMEEGVPSNRIAVLAPEIEEYWPVLQAYLQEEGLPVDKPVTGKLNSIPAVNRWLSRLRARHGDLKPADLELAYYSYQNEKTLRHEEFRALFSKLYGPEDLQRHHRVKEFFDRRLRGENALLHRDAFLEVASQFWEQLEDLEAFVLIAREFLKNATAGLEMNFSDWVAYAEAVTANQEISLEPGESGGLFVANFSSAHAHPATHRFFLGLTEEGLRKAERNPLPMKEVREISKLGFHLDHPDQSLLEFELKWLCDGASEVDVLSVGICSFDGSVRAPSAWWMKMLKQDDPEASAELLQLPQETRWDHLQKSESSHWRKEREWTETRTISLMKRLSLDLGEFEAEPVKTPPLERLSPSSVRTYLDCPFRLASSSLFRLKDLDDADIDVARSELGNLTHAIFQRLTDQQWVQRLSVTEAELSELITQIRDELEIALHEPSLWEPFLKKQVRVAQEFLRVEKDWKARFPRLQILQSEAEWKIWFSPEQGSFLTTATPGSVELRGRVDRLETDGQGHFVVIDYKASRSGLHHHTAWLEQNELQLLFYMWALEKGGLPEIQGEVIGAFYYTYKNFQRDLGFQIEAKAGTLFPSAERKKSLKAEPADKEKLFTALEQKIAEVVERTRKGDWAPRPLPEKQRQLCERCNWNGLCRAPHLN